MLYSIKNARSTFEYKKTDSKFSEKLHIVGLATFDFACLDAVVKAVSWVLVCIKYNEDELKPVRIKFPCRTRELSAEQELLVPVSSADAVYFTKFYASCNFCPSPQKLLNTRERLAWGRNSA